jgi:phosphoglycerate dehydrogenase-like enzyme
MRPTVILAPAPQRRDRIFTPQSLAALRDRYDVVDLEAKPELDLAEHLPRAFAVIGQPDLDTEALESARELRVIANVEGNFFPNVDYATALRHGVRVLGCGPAYSGAVSEYALALALDLARGISREDRAARRGEERYFGAANDDALLLSRANIGILGFGNLGRATAELLAPFRPRLRVYDPWLPGSVVAASGGEPCGLDETLRQSDVVFVFATVTSESTHMLDQRTLALLPDGARLILVSRAAVVDYDALLAELTSGRLSAAVDVWPEEPLPLESPFRKLDNVILSAHRAGGIPQAYALIGEMVVDDLALIEQGLPPVRMQQASQELVGRYRNRPVT